MRSKSLLLGVAALAWTGCAKPDPLCSPVTSWSQPAFRCMAPPPPPPPEPPPPPPKPEPPPPPPPKPEKIDVKDRVEFETDSAVLKPESNKVLDGVVKILTDHPEITKVQIEGYTDSTSTPEHNQKLSDDRANAVRTYMMGKGIAADRLVAKGFGQDVPIGDNNTEAGRRENRRVEFKIIERKQ